MTLYSLMPHPDHPPRGVTGIDVEVRRKEEATVLAYRVAGARSLRVPAPSSPWRTDGLWKTTCFELFLKPVGGKGYTEFNFAPSGQWAAYSFAGYRAEMQPLALATPEVTWMTGELHAFIRYPGLVPGSTAPRTTADPVARWTPAQGRGDESAMALTAVIEETDGTKSYWALAHPPGAPDFHHEACFAATLPAPEQV